MTILDNIFNLINQFYKKFGLIPSGVFILFLLTISIFVLFELIQIFLPFTYVAF